MAICCSYIHRPSKFSFILIRKQAGFFPHSLTIHFPHGTSKVNWILETGEAIALGLVGATITHHLGLHKGWVLAKCSLQGFISHLIAKVTTEHAEIIC